MSPRGLCSAKGNGIERNKHIEAHRRQEAAVSFILTWTCCSTFVTSSIVQPSAYALLVQIQKH